MERKINKLTAMIVILALKIQVSLSHLCLEYMIVKKRGQDRNKMTEEESGMEIDHAVETGLLDHHTDVIF